MSGFVRTPVMAILPVIGKVSDVVDLGTLAPIIVFKMPDGSSGYRAS